MEIWNIVLNEIQTILIKNATDSMNKSFNPYEKISIWSALITNKKNIYCWVNITTCIWNWCCAEMWALSNAFVNWEYWIEKIAIVYYSMRINPENQILPCWICRQILYEICEIQQSNIEIISFDIKNTKILITSLFDIFPNWFWPRKMLWEFEKFL